VQAHIITTFAEILGNRVISYSATDPDLSDRNTYPAFYRTVLSDNASALAVVKLFIRYNWTSCIIIYQNDTFGSNGARIISEAFKDHSLIVRETVVFDIVTYTIRGDFKKLLTSSSTRTVI
jgi:ABC-type branched-subunit amino acid transport system substrate-binding protein